MIEDFPGRGLRRRESQMGMRIRLVFSTLLCGALLLINGCSKSNPSPPVIVTPFFAKGADISWVTEMESDGVKFYNALGVQMDVLQILKDLGMNSYRIRAWVNPANHWNNTRDVVVKAVRAKDLGMKVMIDFHYSDTWADPGHQTKPSAWSALSYTDLKTALVNYTAHVMDTLKSNGVTPDWVQVGNETNDGMLWETGRASTSMANFAGLVSAAYGAVKSVSTDTQVIVHISNGYDNGLFRWIFDGLLANGGQWDIIGMSIYPSYGSGGVASWPTIDIEALNNMNDLVSRYGKPVMVVEVGMPVDQGATCKQWLTDLIQVTKSVSGNNGLGVFYWEPECMSSWNGYGLGAFDNTGKPTVALDAFAN